MQTLNGVSVNPFSGKIKSEKPYIFIKDAKQELERKFWITTTMSTKTMNSAVIDLYFCDVENRETHKKNKPGPAQVGAISKAQK